MTDVTPQSAPITRVRPAPRKHTIVVQLHDRPGALYRAVGLIRRRDYTVDIAGRAPSAQYALDFATVDGLVVATSRKIYSTDENTRKVPDPLIVSIDLKDVKVA